MSPCYTAFVTCHRLDVSAVHTHRSRALVGTCANNCWDTLLVLDGTRAGAASLNRLHGTDALEIALLDLAEDDVAAVEPAGDDSGNEELRAVGVWAGIGHGEEEWLVVGELEVLIGKLLAVDGLSTSALFDGALVVCSEGHWEVCQVLLLRYHG